MTELKEAVFILAGRGGLLIIQPLWVTGLALGGGIYIYGGAAVGVVRNTILAHNMAISPYECDSDAISTMDHDLVDHIGSCSNALPAGNIVGDPKLCLSKLECRHIMRLRRTARQLTQVIQLLALRPTSAASSPRGSACDIGAFEYGGIGTLAANIMPYQGATQYVLAGTPARVNLSAIVLAASGEPVPGVEVTFIAPSSASTGTFANGTNVTTAFTDGNGVAAAGRFAANSVEGSYSVLATAKGLVSSAVFAITNGKAIVKTYTMDLGRDPGLLPGRLLCDLTQQSCTNGTDPEADRTQDYAYGTYVFYKEHFQRKGLDDAWMPIISSVHYDNNFENSFWSGKEAIDGDGYALADDVVAHELTHGVTEHESGLFYYYQSGAINESFSDLFGEIFDQSNGMGRDAPSTNGILGRISGTAHSFQFDR